MSPDGENVVTGAGMGDETLKFWKMFPLTKTENLCSKISPVSLLVR